MIGLDGGNDDNDYTTTNECDGIYLVDHRKRLMTWVCIESLFAFPFARDSENKTAN